MDDAMGDGSVMLGRTWTVSLRHVQATHADIGHIRSCLHFFSHFIFIHASHAVALLHSVVPVATRMAVHLRT
eukprot:COSAG02_NODE_5597_length_4199_cov_11.472778_3_plen_72_part_00